MNDLEKLLSEAAEKIKTEAYAAGWRDAIAAVNKAASDLADPGLAELGDGPETTETAPRGTPANLPAGVTPGSTPYYVLQSIRRRPGMTGAQIVAAVQEGGHDVGEGSIRTTIVRLKARKFIVSRHNKWFPV